MEEIRYDDDEAWTVGEEATPEEASAREPDEGAGEEVETLTGQDVPERPGSEGTPNTTQRNR